MPAVKPTYTVQTLEQVMIAHIKATLELHGWNMSRTAEGLEVDRRTLYRMVKRYNIEVGAQPTSEPPPAPELEDLLDQSHELAEQAEGGEGVA